MEDYRDVRLYGWKTIRMEDYTDGKLHGWKMLDHTTSDYILVGDGHDG